jgi:hypothetical protein
MSLKAFHAFFMVVSILLLVFFGVWAIRDYVQSRNLVNLGLGIVSLQASVLAVWYFSWFLKKLKHLSYL